MRGAAGATGATGATVVACGCGLLLAVIGCTPWERPAPPAKQAADDRCAPAEVQVLLPVVTTLQTRDHEITVLAGDDGLRFTVSLVGGELLGRQLTEAELQRSFPGLHQRFTSAFAGDEHRLHASVVGSRTTPRAAAAGASR